MKIKLFTLVLIASLLGCSENNNEIVKIQCDEIKHNCHYLYYSIFYHYYYNHGFAIIDVNIRFFC